MNNNYKMYTIVQIQGFIDELKIEIDNRLKTYFNNRRLETEEKVDNCKKKVGSKKKKFTIKAENASEMDTIIEEYINLGFVSTHLHDLKESRQQKISFGNTAGKL